MDLFPEPQNDTLNPETGLGGQSVTDNDESQNSAIQEGLNAIDNNAEDFKAFEPTKKTLFEYEEAEKQEQQDLGAYILSPTQEEVTPTEQVIGGVLAGAATMIDGVETLAVDAYLSVAEKVVKSAEDWSIVAKALTGYEVIPQGTAKEYSESVEDGSREKAIKEVLQVSTYLNDVTHSNTFASIDDIRAYQTDVLEKNKDVKDEWITTGAYYAGKLSTEIALVGKALGVLEKAGALTQAVRGATFADVAGASAVGGAIAGTSELGMTADKEKAIESAITAGVGGVVGGYMVKGGVAAFDHWHVNPFADSGTKALKGLEDKATEVFKNAGKGSFEDVKDEFVKNSVYATWEDIPMIQRTTYTAMFSKEGQSILNAGMRDDKVSDALSSIHSVTDKEMMGTLDEIVDLAKKVSIQTGKEIDDIAAVAEPSQTLAYHILVKAGIANAPTGNVGEAVGETPMQAGWNIIDSIIKGTSGGTEGSKKASEKLGDSIRVLGNWLGKEEQKLLVDVAEGVRHSEHVDATYLKNTLIERMHDLGDNVADIPDKQAFYKDQDTIIQNSLVRTFGNDADIGSETAIQVTPHKIWELYKVIKEETQAHFSGAVNGHSLGDVAEKNMKQAILDSLDLISDGANYKSTIQAMVDVERTKGEIIAGAGIKQLVAEGQHMTDREMRQAFYNLGISGQKEFESVLSTLTSKEEREMFELQTLKAFAYRGKINLQQATQTDGAVSASSGGKVIASRIDDIMSLKMTTLKARQLQEYLKVSTRWLEGLHDSTLPSKSDKVGVTSEIMRAAGNAVHRAWGAFQTSEGAAGNTAYMLAKLNKMVKDYKKATDGEFSSPTKIPVTVVDDVTEFPQGALLLRIRDNVTSIKAFTQQFPRPSILGGELAKDIVEHGQVTTFTQLTPVQREALSEVSQKAYDSMVEHLSTKNAVTAQADNAKEWAERNEAIVKQQESGTGAKVIYSVDGSPVMVLGGKALKFKANLLQSVTYGKRLPSGTASGTKISKILDEASMETLNSIARASGKPDYFEGVTIMFDKSMPSSIRGSHQPDTGVIKLNPTALKGESPSDTEARIHDTLVHELQHRGQKVFGRPKGGNKNVAMLERSRRMTALETNLGVKGLSRTLSYGAKMLDTDRKALVASLPNGIVASPNATDVELIELAVFHKTGATPTDLSDSLNIQSIYTQIAGEAEARLVQKLATDGGIDLSNLKVFEDFMDDEVIKGNLTTIWMAGGMRGEKTGGDFGKLAGVLD